MPAAYSDPNKLNHTKLSRNDSLKSERSDKRVSFNKDVGIKHIPRGLKRQAPQPPKDEWGSCTSVHREPPPLLSAELEKQAEDLVRLLDQVDCVAKPNSNKIPPFSSSSLDRANNKANNNRLTKLKNNTVLNLARRNNLNNGDTTFDRSSAVLEAKNKQTLINLRRKKPINYQVRRERRTRPVQRSLSTHSYVNDIDSSDTDYPLDKYNRFKSEPNIQKAINKNKGKQPPYRSDNNISTSDNEGPMSVDNLYKDNRFYQNPYRRRPNARNEYQSADNLTDVSIPGNRQLHEYKSVENLQSGYSSSDIDASIRNSNKINRNPDFKESQQIRSHHIMYDEPPGQRGLKSSNQYYGHNKNKPFSYTGGSLSSIEEVRRLSPSRDIPRYGEDQYAKVNKNMKMSVIPSSKENDFNHPNEDYSAKIIINSHPTRNRYDDDEDAYETYQVRDGNLKKQIKDLGISSHLKTDYKNISNNNINMSSIGVQTEKRPKAPSRQRRQHRSPIRNGYSDENTDKKELSSASLVRQVSQEFGRVERSLSPPPRVIASHRKPQRNIVPLLSDTDESEFNYRRNRDPLAKIRDQVKIREKLQEENEERCQSDGRYISSRQSGIKEYHQPKLQPLTIDEVDALEFEVDSRGRNSLVVAREEYPSKVSKYSNEGTHMKKTANSDQNKTYPIKDRNISHQNSGKEVDITADKSPSRFFSTLERIKKGATGKSKNNLEKKDLKTKDKKKKRIKIKFFYDPRPQDVSAEDPLSRFTEYKGSSSDEIPPLQNNQNYNNKSEFDHGQVKPYRDNRSRSREATLQRRQHYDSSSDKRDYSSSPSRPPRYASKERIIPRDYSTNRSERESSGERTINRTNHRTYFNDNKQSNMNYGYNQKFRNERKYDNEFGVKNHDTNIKNYQSSARNPEYDGGRQERRDMVHNSNDNIAYDRYDTNERRKFSEKNIALSDKYKGLTRSSSPPREIYVMNDKSKTYNDDSIHTEDEEKLGKIQRQRKKFFGVLRGEGRTKPNTKSLFRKQPEPKMSSNTLSKTRGREENQVEAARIIERVKEQSGQPNVSRDRHADEREKRQWENVTSNKTNGRSRSNDSKYNKYFGDSSSSVGTPVNTKGTRSSSRQRYFGDTDSENKRNIVSGKGDYRSLPNRKAQPSTPSRFVMGAKRNFGARRMSPGARGSAGSSLQSSESDADSHGGSHASRASKASHVSTGSNRSVYLHATTVADIPVRRSSDDSPSERGISRQEKKVSRSFSLASPWKPRHYRDRFEVEYDNRDTREVRPSRPKSSLPPRPPRKSVDSSENKRVGRSQTVYKDSRLAGWLRKKKNKEPGKGI